MADFNSTHTGAEIDDAVGVSKGAGTGLVVKTGSGTGAKRTIVGTSNQITVTNGDGVSGNPSISLDSSVLNSLALANTATQNTVFQAALANTNAYIATKVDSNNATLTGVVKIDTTQLHVNAASTFTINPDTEFTSNGAIRLPRGTTSERTIDELGAFRYNTEEAQFEGYGSSGWGQIGGGGSPGGSNTEIQFNDSGTFAGNSALTWNKTSSELTVGGDVVLDDGVAGFETTVQCIPPTANQVISFPDSTGVVALTSDIPTIAGSNTQIQFNNSGVFGASANLTFDTTTDTLTAPNLSVSKTFTANNSELTLKTLSYGANTNLDFAVITGTYQTVSLTGNVAFTTSNQTAGRGAVVRIISDGSERSYTFPTGWKFMGTAAPSTIAANKTAILSLTSFGTANSDMVCAYSVEP